MRRKCTAHLRRKLPSRATLFGRNDSLASFALTRSLRSIRHHGLLAVILCADDEGRLWTVPLQVTFFHLTRSVSPDPAEP